MANRRSKPRPGPCDLVGQSAPAFALRPVEGVSPEERLAALETQMCKEGDELFWFTVSNAAALKYIPFRLV